MEQIVCKNLCLGYDGRAIIDNLNFTVNTGDYLCIVGENG
ncbi:MAG: ABC transporter, partial [Clostridia bacterium]|nr:ABC transporter [Clostridia bacterium]